MENQFLTIKTSEILKGDVVIVTPRGKGDVREVAVSDAYKHNGLWAFDMSAIIFATSTFPRYVFYKNQGVDAEIEVIRKV